MTRPIPAEVASEQLVLQPCSVCDVEVWWPVEDDPEPICVDCIYPAFAALKARVTELLEGKR
jgi:hypothetical protein